MTLEELKTKLQKKAIIFQTGGTRPTSELGESWIGAIKWKRESDEIPKDVDGTTMLPLASVFTGNLEWVPAQIEGIKLCNIFISPNIMEHLDNMDGYFKVQMYDSLEDLKQCDLVMDKIKAFPLVPQLVEDDCPQWDGGMDPDLEDAVSELERSEGIDYYDDIHINDYSMHKVGGYPAYIQPGDWDKEYDFVFQISSDPKAGLNVVDNGSFYFFYNKAKDDWILQCDFF